MNIKIVLTVVLLYNLLACSHNTHNHDEHNHEHDHEENLVQYQVHEDQEVHDAPKLQYTAYSNNFEVFAEADPFVVGENANVLAHFTLLPGFEPLESGKVTVIIQVNGSETLRMLEAPIRKGIYSFDLLPEKAGNGSLRFIIENSEGKKEIVIPDITVFSDQQSAFEVAEEIYISNANTTVFTKEQSWKIDFATRLPEVKPFGQVIKTTALVKPATGDEIVLVAKTGGIVSISTGNILEGEEVTTGERLFSISGSSLDENNLSVRYAEAQNNFERARANNERMKALAEDQIVSQRELLESRNEFENARALFENLRSNFNATGQSVSSPMNGFLKQVFVTNGEYVEAGQPVVTVANNRSLILTADLPQRYFPKLNAIVSANIRDMISDSTYTLEALNGKILSYGKAASAGNFLIPVNLEIDNKGTFIQGSFVEVYLKTLAGANVMVIPNSSLIEEQGNYFVWVQITPELFEKRLVTTGVTDGINTQIEKGIESEERIVSRGAMMIKLTQSTGTLDAHSGHVH